MKTTRKILALLMALTLCLAIAAPAFAEPSEYQIIIDNAVAGETYTVYKIFDVTYANTNPSATAPAPETDIPGEADHNHQYTAYSYTIMDNSEWWSVVTANSGVSQVPAEVELGTSFTANGLTFTKTANAHQWNVRPTLSGMINSFDPFTFAGLLNNNKTGKTQVASVQASYSNDPLGVSNMTSVTVHDTGYATGTITLNLSTPGYYFVDTTTGSLCSLDTTEPTATIREKNSLPIQDKSVSNTADGTYGNSISANIGDTVYFKIEIPDGVGTDAELILHDNMSKGLTLNTGSFTIEANTGVGGTLETGASTTVAPTNNYTIKTKDTSDSYDNPGDADCTFEIVFSRDFIAGLAEGKVITIKYTATVNADAVIADLGNPNTSYVEYSNQTTPTSTAIVYTYAGAIYKVDGTATSGTAPELAGATFAVTGGRGGEIINLVQVDPGSASTPAIYRLAAIVANNGGNNGGEDNGGGSGETPTDPETHGTRGITRGVGDPEPSNIIVTPASGAVVLIGFEDNTVLTLTETVAPTGFNLLAAPVTLTINETHANTQNKTAAAGVTNGATATFVATTYNQDNTVNQLGDDAGKQIHANSIEFIANFSGSELPSTGGIGTRIFIIAGSILVLGAGIFLVAMSVSKRRGEEN